MLPRLLLFSLSLLLLTSCDRNPHSPATQQQVTLYTSVDEPIARPIIQAFTQKTGIQVSLRTDGEATKTAGLADRLEAEKQNPQADVWWCNEPFRTINLANADVLDAYDSPSTREIPSQFKDPNHKWAATALRARVLAIHTADPTLKDKIRSLQDLTSPSLKNKIVMARPSAGTTGGHVAALYTLWGKTKADTYFMSLRDNGITLVGGNSIVAESVANGTKLAGLTDNDDVDAMINNGGKITYNLPDQSTDGTLLIPCTVALVKNAPHPTPAKQLIDYLLSKDVEQQLLKSKFAAYSVFDPAQVKSMPVDYAQVSRNLRESIESCLKILENR